MYRGEISEPLCNLKERNKVDRKWDEKITTKWLPRNISEPSYLKVSGRKTFTNDLIQESPRAVSLGKVGFPIFMIFLSRI